MADVAEFARLAGREHGLSVVSTLRADLTIQATVVNCGVLDHPLRGTTIGDNYISRKIWETPDTMQTLLVYPGDLQVYFEGTFCNAHRGAMITFMGTEATLYIDREIGRAHV